MWYVRVWHLADNRVAPAFVRFWGHSRQRWVLAGDSLAANDPKRTSPGRSTTYAWARPQPLSSVLD